MRNNIFLFIFLSYILSCEKTEDSSTSSTFATEMLSAVNKLRKSGCNCGSATTELKWNAKLEAAALRHAKDMSENNHFSHTGTDNSTFDKRIKAAGYSFKAAGENIAYGYSSISSVMKSWENSSGHCKNMMNASYTEMGAAKVGIYWVQVFAAPSK